MEHFKLITLPASWESTYTGTPEQIHAASMKFTVAMTDQFMAHFAGDRFCKLDTHEKMNIGSLYKCLLLTINNAEQQAVALGCVENLWIECELNEMFENVFDYIHQTKLLDDIFYSFLAEDSGNDLTPDGYINTTAVKTKTMLADLFADLLRYNFENALAEKDAVELVEH